MLDISRKYPTLRTAIAEARLALQPDTLMLIREGRAPKGDPLGTARIAAVMGAKQTSTLIPFCHPIQVDYVRVEFELGSNFIHIRTEVKAVAPTGVEMEALTAASMAALTVYDMLKMADKGIIIERVRLVDKRGGKSDFCENAAVALRAAVLVMSDTVAAGKKPDASGRLIEERLRAEGLEVADYRVIPDEPQLIKDNLIRLSDELQVDLILTTGGTGFSPRDATPEAMMEVLDREIPGIPEAVRAYGQQRTPYAMLSRAKAGLRGRTLIINLPGSRRGVAESLDLLFPAVLHAFPMIAGAGGWSKSDV